VTLRRSLIAGLAAASALVAPLSAKGASLQAVSNWGISGLPSDVSMYVYVPDKVAQNPPILTLIHYCGGTASAVFGQAQGGGIVKAADQYGFIMVVPSSGRCWDIVSDKTRKRDGGGDSHAIRQMVKYAVDKYQANPDRVYSTGDSSGGMMTELLLAVYPDVFKAGSAFAGMPAACRGSNETGSGGGYSNACAGGSVTHTAQEWGDLVRGLNPGYTGHRPRVQLFHGDMDTTINYKNFTEAIKEWSNVLGLQTNPTSTDSALTLGTHQAKRQTWQNSCAFSALDAFTSIGGDHGPSDTLFVAKYVIPFLGLDKLGSVDPEIQQCSGAGAGGTGGSGGGGAGNGAGGASSGGTGSGSAGTSPGAGTGAGGSSSSNSGGGGAASGGASGSAQVAGGSPSSGAPGAAGNQSGGSAGLATSLGGHTGISGAASNGQDAEANGCSCHLAERREASRYPALVAVFAAGLALSSRRARSRKRRT
jgi:acetylxylan esterase